MKGGPFLLAVGGEEIVISLSVDGEKQVIGGSETALPDGVIDVVTCLVDTIGDLIENILDSPLNPFTIIVVVLNAVFRILGCIFSLIF